MNFEIQNWMEEFSHQILTAFPERVCFIGLQGSYRRGEATRHSDIDPVVVLDVLHGADLRRYDQAISSLPHREKICGFLSGKREIEAWEPWDLFQFYYDTLPYYGSLDFLLARIQERDIRQAVHLGACNLYHAAVHNAVHEKDPDILRGLFKSLRFILQAKYYCETHRYLRSRDELLSQLSGMDRQVLASSLWAEKGLDLEQLSDLLISWASRLIISYADPPDQTASNETQKRR